MSADDVLVTDVEGETLLLISPVLGGDTTKPKTLRELKRQQQSAAAPRHVVLSIVDDAEYDLQGYRPSLQSITVNVDELVAALRQQGII